MLIEKTKMRLRGFARDEDGNITVEAVIIFPVLLWLFAACWVYFDVFRQQSVNQKANYTIGDAISRETDPIDDRYIDGAHQLLYHLDKSQGTDTDLRITIVRYNANNDKYQVVWSEARGDHAPLKNGDMKDYEDRLPTMAHLDQVIVVETWDWYEPLFSVGLGDFDIRTYSFTRPRYAPQILWYDEGQNNGWGNGDQEAPGGSLCNNNAENATDCTNEDGSQNIEPADA